MKEQTPDVFFPLVGPVFIAAVEGHSNDVVAAYVFALLHYWHVNHCEGMRDDSEWLRKVCRQDKDAWPAVYPVVFGGFFHKSGGLWRQKRADEEWARAKFIMDKRSTAGKLGAIGRWGNRKGPPPRKQ